MDLGNVKYISIAAGEVKQIVIDGEVVWKRSYTNAISTSINADGTIYNGTGYKDGYRIRSGGAEAAVSRTTCSGFIKVNAGDVIRISGCNFDYAVNQNAINVSDSSFTNIGQFTMFPARYGIFTGGEYDNDTVVEEKTGVWKWIVPPAESGVAYIRVSAYNSTSTAYPSANLILTINEEID